MRPGQLFPAPTLGKLALMPFWYGHEMSLTKPEEIFSRT